MKRVHRLLIPTALALAAGFSCAQGLTGSAAPQTAAAAPAAPARLSLAEAYRMAFEQDAVLRAARAATDAKRERLPQARAQLLPNVSAGASRNRNHLHSVSPGFTEPVASESRYFSGTQSLTVRQGLIRPYQWAEYRQAQAQVADANAQLERETQNLAVRVSTAYMGVLVSQDQLALVMAQKNSYSTQLDAARKRFAGGAGVRTDIDEAKARLDMAVAKELEARQQVDYARRQLQNIVNTPVAEVAGVDPARLDLDRADTAGLQDWVDRAEQASPELQSLKAQREAAREDIEKARSGHLPTVDAIAQWSVNQNDTVTSNRSRYENKTLGIQLNVPIFAGGGVNSQVRQGLAELERVEQALEATRRDVALRIEKEYRGVNEGRLKIRALEQAVKSSEIMVQSNRRSYEGGVRTLLDVLNAEEARVTALRDLAGARADYLLSQVRLNALVGAADAQSIAALDAAFKR